MVVNTFSWRHSARYVRSKGKERTQLLVLVEFDGDCVCNCGFTRAGGYHATRNTGGASSRGFLAQILISSRISERVLARHCFEVL